MSINEYPFTDIYIIITYTVIIRHNGSRVNKNTKRISQPDSLLLLEFALMSDLLKVPGIQFFEDGMIQ